MLRSLDRSETRTSLGELFRCRDGASLAAWLASDCRELSEKHRGLLAVCPEETRDWELWRFPGLAREKWAAGDPMLAAIRERHERSPCRLDASAVTANLGEALAFPLRDSMDRLMGALVMAKPEMDAELDRLETWLTETGALATFILERISTTRRLLQLEHEVAELESLKNDFMDTVSHELRTPLTSILGFSDLALQIPDLDALQPLPDFLRSIHGCAEKLDRLIGEVLMMSRITGVEALLEISDNRLGPLLREFQDATLPELAGHERLCWSDYPAERTLRADPGQFLRVLEHLIRNALAFSGDDQQVQVEFRALIGRRRGDETDYLSVDVIDRGPGIAPEEQQRIFQKFYQVDGSSTRARGGVGLGLALVKELTEAMGGRLWLDSNPGEGSTFSFTVPLLREDGSSPPLAV